jgi:hydroxyacylglutathione hydrolase
MVRVEPIPAFDDNYIWLIRAGENAAVVDPGDADPVVARLEAEGLALRAVLCTHHHGDHVGGVADLLRRYPVPVYGPRAEGIRAVSHPLAEGDQARIPELGLAFQVLDVPGHTRGHIAYLGHGMLFCGDTLFAAGCGRVFEGTPEQLYASLQKLASLPPDTLVYCAHEYTLSNIRFARAANPGNRALEQREASARQMRERREPTLPSTLKLELATNPFLRCADPEIAASASARAAAPVTEPVEVFAVLRDWKNRFR